MTFNLIRERWIPVLHIEYGTMLVNLREVFKRAGDLTLCHVDPLVTASLRRVLLAVVEDALNPTPEMRRTWLEKGLPYRKLCNYLAKHPFDLLDPERPFYQVADLVCSKRSSHTVLDPGGNRDNNRLVGNLTMTCDPPPIPLAEAAVLLITAQTFSPVGGTSSHGHSSASPLANMPLTYGVGPNLLYDLAANASTKTLPPTWRSELHSTEAVKAARNNDLSLHPYTPFPRMIRLHPEGNAVRFASVAAGLKRDATGDPMVAQVQGGGVQHERGDFSLVAAADLLFRSPNMEKPLVLDRIAELGVAPANLTTLRFRVKQGVVLGADKYEFDNGSVREEAATLTHAANAKQWKLEQWLDYEGANDKENRTKASSQRTISAVDMFRTNGEALVRQHFAEGKTVAALRERLNRVSTAVQADLKPPLHQALTNRKTRQKGAREKPVRFVERLETLYPSDRTLLKQKGSLEAARRVSTFLPRGSSVWTQECYTLIARLYAHNPRHDAMRGDLGSIVGSSSLAQSDAAFARALQAQTFEELSDAVGGTLRCVEEPVNWSLLLTDLLDWRTPSKGVVTRWQTSFERTRRNDQKNV